MFLIIIILLIKKLNSVVYISLFVKFVDYVFRMGELYVILYQVMEVVMKQEMKQGTL